ncbi:MAG: hypothetical protein ACON4N_10665 [Myxococcota bacterium]
MKRILGAIVAFMVVSTIASLSWRATWAEESCRALADQACEDGVLRLNASALSCTFSCVVAGEEVAPPPEDDIAELPSLAPDDLPEPDATAQP